VPETQPRQQDLTDRVRDLEEQAEVDRLLIAELHAQGVLDRKVIGELRTQGEVDQSRILDLEADKSRDQAQIGNLELALNNARRIGAAIGILMLTHKISEAQAFDMLRHVSQNSHRKLRDVADDVVITGTLPQT
jgi:hypothetical protein